MKKGSCLLSYIIISFAYFPILNNILLYLYDLENAIAISTKY